MRLVLRCLSFTSVIALAACAATGPEPTTSGDEDLTSVTDLSALETELGLVKDMQDAHGNWSRPDAKLSSGPCYARTAGGPHGASFEFRRYKQGAAFFSKRGTTPATGDMRPVQCVDLDVTPYEKGAPDVAALAGIALDVAMRYHLGRLTGSDAGLGHEYLDFERGPVEISGAAHYCGFHGDLDRSPGAQAFNQALAACKVQGNPEEACYDPALTACQAATTADIAKNTIDRPAFDATDKSDATYFYDVELRTGNDSVGDMPGSLASVIYRYASKATAQGDYTLAHDPVGKFLTFEYVPGQTPSEEATHYRFERLDAHRVVDGDVERLAITPKNSDATILETALVLCSRTYDSKVGATGDYECRGL